MYCTVQCNIQYGKCMQYEEIIPIPKGLTPVVHAKANTVTEIR